MRLQIESGEHRTGPPGAALGGLDVPAVHADFGQLRQAFVNVALNGCEAMGKGGKLTITTRVDGPDVELVLSDTGPGITKEHLSKIFDPFFTTKEKGTGLGLSVVYGVVERHGGTLTLDSEPGAGTAVTIRLPLVSGAAPGTPAAAAGIARGVV